MRPYRDKRRASATLACLATLGSGACSSTSTTSTTSAYTVQVSGLPMNATALHAIAISDGRALDGLGRLPLGMFAGREQVTFSVEPPAGAAGRLALSLAVVGDKDCILGLGDSSVALGEGQALPVRIQALPTAACPSGGALGLPYVLSGSPATLTPGQEVAVTLRGFGFLPGVVVLLNGAVATKVQYNSPTEIIVTTPSTIAGGPVALSVQNPGQPAQTTATAVAAPLSEAKLVVSNQVIRGVSSAVQIVAQDINNDKKVDLIVGRDDGPVMALFGTGAGIFPGGPSFSSNEGFTLGGAYQGAATRNEVQMRLNVVDVNQDGVLDLIQNGGSSTFIYTAGKGGASPPFEMPLTSNGDGVGNTTTTSLVGDLNKDGAPDLVILGDADGGAAHATLRQPKGIAAPYLRANFSKHVFPGFPVQAELIDLNGDGLLDVVAALRIPGGHQVCALLNQLDAANPPRVIDPPIGLFLPNIKGAPQFCQTLDTVNANPVGMVVTDLDGDALPDIAVLHATSGERGYLQLLYNNKDAGGQISRFRKAAVDRVGTYPWGLAAGDLNGDGRPELVVANRQDGVVTVLTNDGKGGLDGKKIMPRAIPVDSTSQNVPLYALSILDVNGDGRLDIVTGYNSIYIISNQGLMNP